MLEVAVTIHERGYCMLGKAFRHVSPAITYSAELLEESSCRCLFQVFG